MPFPTERSGRCRPSPLPAQTRSGRDHDTASAPIEPVGCASKIGAHVRPASVVFQTPPLFGAM